MSDSIEALRTAISGAKALIVCGAGVSRAVTGGAAPGWKGLIESAIDSAPKEPGEDWSEHCREGLKRNDPDAWLSSADMAQKKLGGFSNNSYRAWLMKNVGELQASEPALLDAIIALNCRLATTNYDGLLCTKKGVQPKTWRNPESVAEILTGKSQNVWHIHGYWDDPESVIFSTADYDRVGRSDRAQFLQQQAAFADTLIFIGCSASGLADQNVGRLLNWFGSSWGGLGKKHFALVTDDEVETPGWPDNVTRVPYGPKHEKLLEFLRSLDPRSSAPQASASKVNRIDLAIANPHPVGRRDEINRVVTAATEGRPCLITGGPGMGKSTVAVAASYDERLIEKFGERRVFVNIENRTDPLDILILLAAELGLSPEPKQSATLAAIRYSCEQESTFALLDNVEGLIEAAEPETSRILGLLRDTAGLSFVVTSREGLPFLSGWIKIDDLPPLSLEESRDLFCKIATSVRKDDPDLEPLLIALDGHALSLTIMASRVDSDLTLGPMLKRWEQEKAELLRQPGAQENRHNSVVASLRVSLTSKHMSVMARRLLAILGFLPDGVPAGGLKAFLGHEDRRIKATESDAANEVLRRLRLVAPRPDGSIKLLNPLREAVSIEKPLKGEELQRVVRAIFKLLEKGKYFGTAKWPAAEAELLPHLRNFTPVLLQAGRNQPIREVRQAIESARLLSMGERRFDQSTFLRLASVLQQRNASESKNAVAQAFDAAGDLALWREDMNTAHTLLEEARDIFLQTGDRLGQANALQSLGILALRRDDLDAAQTYFKEACNIYLQIGEQRLGQANTLQGLGNLALRRDDLDAAQTSFEEARDIFHKIGERLGQANTLRGLGNLALRRDDLGGAQTYFKEACNIFLQIGERLGQANAFRSLGALALRRDDLDAARTYLQEARDTSRKIAARLSEANANYLIGHVEVRLDLVRSESTFTQVLQSYESLGDKWGIAHSRLRLAQIAACRGDRSRLPDAVNEILLCEASHPTKLAARGWRAFCACLTEEDEAKCASLRDEARGAWTKIGALGLIRDYLDFEIEVAHHGNMEG